MRLLRRIHLYLGQCFYQEFGIFPRLCSCLGGVFISGVRATQGMVMLVGWLVGWLVGLCLLHEFLMPINHEWIMDLDDTYTYD